MRRITCERSSGSWAAHTNTTPWKLAPLAARPALRSARRRRWPSRPIGLPLGSRASRASRLVRFMPMRYSAVSGTRAYAAQRRLGHSGLCGTAPSRAFRAYSVQRRLGRFVPIRYSAVSGSRALGRFVPMQYSAVFIPRYRLFAASPFPGLYGILLGPFSDQTCAGLMK